MFVPKGYLPVTTAVGQLAALVAGQSNDDAQNVARAELRAELHSGSLPNLVLSPSSGKSYKIRLHRWAGEEALTWLEQGECLLAEGLVDPPLGMLSGEEYAPIFVGEHDFQRLLAAKRRRWRVH
jgi:hypothetical protein